MISLSLFAADAKKDKPVVAAVKSDIPYIRCSVCEATAKNLFRQITSMRKDARPGTKLKEIDILETIEKVCDPEKEEGEWITKIDLVEDGTALKLVEQDTPQLCNTECKTIARSCADTLGDADTDIAEALFKGDIQRAGLESLLCVEVSGACNKKPPPLPKTRKPGPAFAARSEDDLEMEKIKKEMEGMEGMNLNMYNKADLMEQLMEEAENEDEDDDEEDSIGKRILNAQMSTATEDNAEQPWFIRALQAYVENMDFLFGEVAAAARSAVTSAMDMVQKLTNPAKPEL